MESLLPSMRLLSYHSVPALLCTASCISTSQGLCYHTMPVHHCVSCNYLSLQKSTARYCYLYKTMVVSHEDKQNCNKLAIDTWSVSEIAVTARLSKTELQEDQRKVRMGKLRKPGASDSVQSLQPVAENGKSGAVIQMLMEAVLALESKWRGGAQLVSKRSPKQVSWMVC